MSRLRAAEDRVLATILHARVEGHRVGGFMEHAARECDWFRDRALDMSAGHLLAAFDGPARAIRCAASLAESAPRFQVIVSVGMHTGECTIAGDSASGLPVDLAAHIATRGRAGEILVSRTVCDIVGDARLPFAERGVHEFPGMGSWALYRV